jgi:translocation and assembly module TamB
LPLKIRVDDVRLASLSLNPEGWNAYALQAAYAYDGRQHSLRLQSLRLNQGTLGAQLSLNPHAPFALKGEVHGAQAQQAVELEASGSLQRLLLRGRVQSAQVGVDLQGVFVPFAAQPYLRIASLELHARGVDPHALQADWPHATLDAKAFLRPDPIKGVAGHLRLDNRLPGAWSEGRLPLKTLTSDFVLLDSSLRVSSMLAQLTQGQIRLQGGVRPQRLTVDAQLSGVGLRALHGALPADVVSGHLALNGSLEAPRLQARLQGQKLRVAADDVCVRPDGCPAPLLFAWSSATCRSVTHLPALAARRHQCRVAGSGPMGGAAPARAHAAV